MTNAKMTIDWPGGVRQEIELRLLSIGGQAAANFKLDPGFVGPLDTMTTFDGRILRVRTIQSEPNA